LKDHPSPIILVSQDVEFGRLPVLPQEPQKRVTLRCDGVKRVVRIRDWFVCGGMTKNPKFFIHKPDPTDETDPPVSYFSVQMVFPVDNPVDNVRKRRVRGGFVFEVPINFPGIHNLTLTQLLIISEEAANCAPVHSP
jgi:hypothetical protein